MNAHCSSRVARLCRHIPLNAEYAYSSQAYDAAYGIPESVPRPPYLLLYPRFDELIARYRFINRWDQVRFCLLFNIACCISSGCTTAQFRLQSAMFREAWQTMHSGQRFIAIEPATAGCYLAGR